ncbi:transcriptional regulator [Porphyrobacter sp. AAP60]|uniref:transcriptional regulator n=1 Tax=Porphyrobacter sp. AAP60 TaxID=1523423 RepID=UPI0006B8D5E2|nr:transcriptional regulator [Porphyrobacter sp. AAP60]KPF62442.1 hypothetical protein IP79_12695 [Porphyrobacter sp. AAP60]
MMDSDPPIWRSASKPNNTKSFSVDEVPIMEAGYRLLAEPQAFDELIAAWRDRIEAYEASQVDTLESEQLARTSTIITSLFGRLPADTPEQGIEQYTRNLKAPALVMTLNNQVVAANEAVADRFGVVVGRQTGLEWIEPGSCSELDKLRRSARIKGNQMQIIMQLAHTPATNELAEARIIHVSAETAPMILVRVLANPWNARVSRMLNEAFGLTEAEVEIARMLYAHSDPAQVAEVRGTSLRTVRNQLQQIFDKTQASGQVELMRLIALLCANTADQASPQARWTDPLGRERMFQDRHGRNLAYSWMGKEGGRPALLIHGPISGYVLAPEIEAAVTAEGIQIFTLCRPGFGNSDPGQGDALEDGVNAILALAEHLDFRDCLGIGLVNGVIPLIEAAAREPGRFSRLLGIGGTFPLTPADLKGLPPVQRTVFALAHKRAKSLEVIVAAGLRLARRYGVEFVLARATAASQPDREALFHPDNLARVMASASMVIAQDETAFTRDLSLMFHDFLPALSPTCPLHMLVGEFDPIFQPVGVGAMAEAGLCTYEIVPGAGQFVYYSAPDQVAEAICGAFAQ